MKNMEHFHEMKSLTRKQKFCLLSLIPAYFIVIGLVVQPLQEMLFSIPFSYFSPFVSNIANGSVRAVFLHSASIIQRLFIIFILRPSSQRSRYRDPQAASDLPVPELPS